MLPRLSVHIGDKGLVDTCFLGTEYSRHVDIYNATNNSWIRYPMGLGEARGYLTAASLPSGLVFFAGGRTSGWKLLHAAQL